MGNTSNVPKTEIVTVFDVTFIPLDKKMYQDEYFICRCYSKQEANNVKNANYNIKNKDGNLMKLNDVKGNIIVNEKNELFYK